MSEPFYRTAVWQKLRAQVLKRDPRCTAPGCTARSVVADHIVQRSKGGPDAMSNLRGMCIPCHNARSWDATRIRGCGADGTPLDPDHWWNGNAVLKNSSEGGERPPWGGSFKVSFPGKSDG